MPDVTSGQGDLWFSKKERTFSWQDRSKDKAIPLIVKSHPAIGSTLQVPNILSAVNLGATHSSEMSLFLPDLRCESPHTLSITRDDASSRGRRQLPLQIKVCVKAEFPLVKWSNLEHVLRKTEFHLGITNSESPSCASRCHPWPFMHFRRLCWHLSATATSLSLLLLHSVTHTPNVNVNNSGSVLQQNPSLPKCWWTERENPLPPDPSSSCFEFIAPRKTRQLSSFCQCPLCSNPTEPSRASVSRQGNVSWSAACCTKIVYLLTVPGMQH